AGRFIGRNLLLLSLTLFGAGCASLPREKWSVACAEDGWPELPGQAEKKDTDKPPGPPSSALHILGSRGQCYRYRIRTKTPRTSLEWQFGKEEEKDDGEEEDKPEADKDKPNEEKQEKDDEIRNGSGDGPRKAEENRNNGKRRDEWEIEYEQPLETD